MFSHIYLRITCITTSGRDQNKILPLSPGVAPMGTIETRGWVLALAFLKTFPLSPRSLEALTDLRFFSSLTPTPPSLVGIMVFSVRSTYLTRVYRVYRLYIEYCCLKMFPHQVGGVIGQKSGPTGRGSINMRVFPPKSMGSTHAGYFCT